MSNIKNWGLRKVKYPPVSLQTLKVRFKIRARFRIKSRVKDRFRVWGRIVFRVRARFLLSVQYVCV